MAVRSRARILTVVLCVVFRAYPLQAQVPVRDLQALEGPWECRNSGGAVGFFIAADTSLTQKGGRPDIASQSIYIRVYQRRGEQEQGGYFSPSTYLDQSTRFDGKRLIIHFKDWTDIHPFDLDVTFDQAAKHWTGSFSLCDKQPGAVLERPRQREGVPHSAFVGNWQGGTAGTLQIRQGYDGGLTAWRDGTRTGLIYTDQQKGEPLRVVSATQSTIILEAVGRTGGSRYRGTLSVDGKSMEGHWNGADGGTSYVPTLYRRSWIKQ